jgi:putative addiction module component (TIGR02574 family)
MTRAEELLEQVKALPPDERDEFDLLYSYPKDDESAVTEEWDEEIRRRVEDWKSGKADAVSWETIQSKLRAKLDAS